MKKLTGLILSTVVCFGSVIPALASEPASNELDSAPDAAQPEASDVSGLESQQPVLGSTDVSKLEGYHFHNMESYIISIPGNDNLRWNMNNTGGGPKDVVHLDDRGGLNYSYRIYGDEYNYSTIKFDSSGYYVDSEGDNNKANEVLHNGHTEVKQDNQKFRFVPVRDANGNVEKDAYYVLSKKGDTSGFDLYVGLQDNKNPAKGVKIATTKQPFKWIVRPFYEPLGGIDLQTPKTADATIWTGGLYVANNTSSTGEDLYLAKTLYGDDSVYSFCTFNNVSFTMQNTSKDSSHNPVANGYWVDVEDRSYDSGKIIHAWKKNQPEDLTRMWLLINAGNDYVYIQNALTKKYMAPQGGNAKEGVKLVTSDSPYPFIVSYERPTLGLGSSEGNWKESGAGWSFVLENGKPVSNALITIDGVPYAMNEDGIMETGWVNANGGRRYYDSTGAGKNGWMQKDGKWFFFNEDGSLKTGWHDEGESRYRLHEENGEMITGSWTDPEGTTWIFTESGVLQG